MLRIYESSAGYSTSNFSKKKKAQIITFLKLKIYTNSEAMFL